MKTLFFIKPLERQNKIEMMETGTAVLEKEYVFYFKKKIVRSSML